MTSRPPPAAPPSTLAEPSLAIEPPRPQLALLAKQASDTWLLAFKARDPIRLASAYTEDACITIAGRRPVCGRSAIADAARAAWARLPDVRAAWGRTWWSGDVLAVESAWSADGKGAVALTLCWFTPEGQIREQHVYADESPKGRPFDGLSTTRETHESIGAKDEQANVEILQASFPALALADDAELVDYAAAGSLVGKKYAARWTGGRAGGLSGAHAALTRSWGIGSYLVCEYETTGRKTRGGETVTLHGAEVLEIEGGKVKRGWRYEDSLELSPPSGLPPMVPFAVP